MMSGGTKDNGGKNGCNKKKHATDKCHQTLIKMCIPVYIVVVVFINYT